MPRSDMPAGLGARSEYSRLGLELMKKLGIDPKNGGGERAMMNAMWTHPETGGTIYVGNQTAARGPSATLLEKGITHVVNCTDDLPNFCQAEGKQKYLKFNIAHWQSAGHTDFRRRPNEEIVAFLESMLAWVDAALASGGSVLVHCLAGAHRAGTTGILCLMHKTGMSRVEATGVAQTLRPIIEPISDFPECLRLFEAARKAGGGSGEKKE